MIDSKELKNYTIVILIGYIMVVIGVFALNYGNTDWEKVSEEIGESVETYAQAVHCEMEYNGLRYSGLCNDREEIFQFVKDLETYGNYSRDKDREHYCKVGAYWLWMQMHPDADIVAWGENTINYSDIEQWCEGADWS